MRDRKQKIIDKEADAALIRLAEGDKSALSVIYDLYGRLIMSVAYTIVEDISEAEDVLQETMIELVRYAQRYRAGSNPRAYILTVTRHRAVDAVRKRHLPTPLDENEEVPADDRHLEAVEVLDMLSSLSQEERQVITLHLYAGLPHRQVGRVMGISTASAEKKYQRALKKLKKYYES